MKPVFQNRFGKPLGNCWEACVASILEVDLSDIPTAHREEWEDAVGQERVYKLLEYLHSLGYNLVEFKMVDGEGVITMRVPSDYYILCGENHQGLGHTVVALGNEIVHNPNPTDNGILHNASAYQILYKVSDFDILPLKEYK